MSNRKHLHTAGRKCSRTYAVWVQMRYRCNTVTSPDYPRYGGRGISVCERWDSFEKFLTDMGVRPEGMEIDRKDNDGNYEPLNCRWTTESGNSDNRRNGTRITHAGETLSVMGWAKKLGIPWPTLDWRLKRWPIEKAITLPVREKRA